MGITTRCRLFVECELECHDGHGYALLTREVEWPGVPAVGMVFTGNAESTEQFAVESIRFTVQERHDEPPQNPPRLDVDLDGKSFGRLGSERHDRQKFIDDLQRMLDDGWKPYCDKPQWVDVHAVNEELELGEVVM